MANTQSQDIAALDAFLASMGATSVQPSTPAPKASTPSAPNSDVNNPDNQGTRAQLAKAYQAAEEAALSFKTAIAKYQAGILTKEGLAAVFKDYTTAQDQLDTMDRPGAEAIQKQYFGPTAAAQSPLAGGGKPGANAPQISAGQDANGNVGGVAPTIVFDKNGNPVKNPDGSYKTAVGATAPTPGTVASSTAGGTSSNSTTTNDYGTGGFVPVPKGQTFADAVKNSTFGVQGPQTVETWASQYGGIGAFALTMPWMKNLLTQAATNGWSGTKFTNEVKNYVDPTTGQKPWDQLAAGYRDSALAYYDNKQQWALQYNERLKVLQDSAIRQGEDPSVFGQAIPMGADGKTIDSKAIDAAYADQHNGVNTYFNSYYNANPDQSIIDKYVSTHTKLATTDNGVYAGVIGQNIDTLKSYASDMGISSMYLPATQGGSGDWYANTAKLIQDGTKTLEQAQNELQQTAMATYKPFANRIKEGMTVKALASPYLNAAANLLEVSPDTIDLGASTGLGYDITKHLQGDGNTSTPLDQFITSIKQRPEWLQTGNARNSLMDTATTFLRNMGMVTGG